MRFAIANTFQKALQKLEGKDSAAAKLAKQVAFDFQMKPTQSGFSFERLNKSKDPNFWSRRVDDNIRIIAHRASDMVTMCYVDRHDEASKRSFNGPGRVTGSDGTGKSVFALHRAAWLAW